MKIGAAILVVLLAFPCQAEEVEARMTVGDLLRMISQRQRNDFDYPAAYMAGVLAIVSGPILCSTHQWKPDEWRSRVEIYLNALPTERHGEFASTAVADAFRAGFSFCSTKRQPTLGTVNHGNGNEFLKRIDQETTRGFLAGFLDGMKDRHFCTRDDLTPSVVIDRLKAMPEKYRRKNTADLVGEIVRKECSHALTTFILYRGLTPFCAMIKVQKP